MSINSTISVQLADGKVMSIYCHWDGYKEYNGYLLKTYYATMEKAVALLSGGNLSKLGKELGEKHDFDKPSYKGDRTRSWCVYYTRDHGDVGEEFKLFESIKDFRSSLRSGEHSQEYNYLLTDCEWKVSKGRSLVFRSFDSTPHPSLV